MSHNTTNPKALAAMKEMYMEKEFVPTYDPSVNHTAPVSPTWRKWRQENPEKYSVLIDTDSYKVSMWQQYPEGTTAIYSYIEARGGEFDETVWFGLQAFTKRLEANPITADEVEYANGYWTSQGLPFNYGGWMYIVNNYGGKLPLRIRGVDEGTVVPVKNILADTINTDPNLFWLTTWVETPELRVWYPTTTATLSWNIKVKIQEFLDRTATPDAIPMVMPFRLHDFGARGVSSYESASIGGGAHLVNFMGTDTGAACDWLITYYDAQMDPLVEAIPDTGIMVSPGYSIPAAEHSTITSWGRENEIDAFRNMIEKFGKPGGLVAVVSDSYDFFAACDLWGTELKEQVETMGGTLVVRPDSGDPTIVPVQGIERLGQHFGYTVNEKGYKVLPDCVKLIQGDGINLKSIVKILENLEAAGWSAENIAFGMGGALLQGTNRDTQKWAMKCSAALVNGEWRDVFKDPATDPGKVSKKGIMSLIKNPTTGLYESRRAEEVPEQDNLLLDRFVDGETYNVMTFDDIRDNSEAGLVDRINWTTDKAA